MMPTVLKAVVVSAVALLAALSTSAQAATFDFSYTFSDGATIYTPNPQYDGAVISGSFSGTLTGDVVTNISNVQASLNGKALNGPLYAYSYTAAGSNCGTCFSLTGATASFNPMKNNFLFIDSNTLTPGGFVGVTNDFYVIPWPNDNQSHATQFFSAGNTNQNYIDYYNGQYVAGNWNLSQVSAVPLPAALPMFGAALVGLGGLARRRAKKTA